MLGLEERVYDRLILSGMVELEEHGFADFSLRRAAQRAQVSCAAPYRHFKDKEAYIHAIVADVHEKWELLSHEVERIFSQDAARRTVELCIASLRFRLGNPHVLPVLSLASREALSFDDGVVRAVDVYAREHALDAEARERKLFTVRALLLGACAMIGTCPEEELLTLTRRALEHELP